MSYKYAIKFIIVGDTAVGKSCLVLRFSEKIFREEHEVTMGVEFGAAIINIRGDNLKLHIWDTAGQEAFKSITKQYIRGSAGALVVFDITRRKSFESVKEWLLQLQENGNPSMDLLLIGNKLDLAETREVSSKEAKDFADKNQMLYIETSAFNGTNVEQAFSSIASKVHSKIIDGTYDVKTEKFGIKVGSEYDGKVDSNTRLKSLSSGKASGKKRCCQFDV